MQLVNGTFSNGDTEMFRDLYNSPSEQSQVVQSRADMYFILERLPFLCRCTEPRVMAMEAYKDNRKVG